MKKHFVTFYSPGTVVAERTTLPVKSWDVEAAKVLMDSITERHGAVPYGFMFTTRKSSWRDFDSKETARSGMHYVDCVVHTLAELQASNLPADQTMIRNMECNDWDRCVTTTKGWAWSQPLREGDVVL